MKLTLPYPPTINHYYIRKLNGGLMLSPEGRAYRDEARYKANLQVDRLFKGQVGMKVLLYRPSARGDIDNICKALLDSLNGVAYKDDGQICELHLYRYTDKKNPRVEVEVWEVTS